MTNVKSVITIPSFAGGIAADTDNNPVCVIVGYDTVPPAGEHLLAGVSAGLTDDGIFITTSSNIDIILQKPAQEMIDGIQAGLPIVVSDPETGRDVLIVTTAVAVMP